MTVSKAQKKVVDALINGGYVWTVGQHPYLAEVVSRNDDGSPVFKSHAINGRTFRSMVDSGTLRKGYHQVGMQKRMVWLFGGMT